MTVRFVVPMSAHVQRPVAAVRRVLTIAARLVDMASNRSGAMQVQAAKSQMDGGKIDMQLCLAA